jgi:hypothetical protein
MLLTKNTIIHTYLSQYQYKIRSSEHAHYGSLTVIPKRSQGKALKTQKGPFYTTTLFNRQKRESKVGNQSTLCTNITHTSDDLSSK